MRAAGLAIAPRPGENGADAVRPYRSPALGLRAPCLVIGWGLRPGRIYRPEWLRAEFRAAARFNNPAAHAAVGTAARRLNTGYDDAGREYQSTRSACFHSTSRIRQGRTRGFRALRGGRRLYSARDDLAGFRRTARWR